MNFRKHRRGDARGVSLDETTTEAELDTIFRVFNNDKAPNFKATELAEDVNAGCRERFARTSAFLTHPVFNRYHSETEMMRYIKRLEWRDLSLTTSMIPLGVLHDEVECDGGDVSGHVAGVRQVASVRAAEAGTGYQMISSSSRSGWRRSPGFAGISLQPNAGSQGEYAACW